MALVVTPGAVDAVAYSDLAAALVRAGLDVRGTTFAAIADAAEQEQLLTTGAAMIDAALIGSARLRSASLSDTQAMVLPLVDVAITKGAVLANQLMAFHLADRKSLGEVGTPVASTGNIKRDKVGPLETEFFAPTASGDASALAALPTDVDALLAPYLTSAVVAWSSGRAVRAT